jgi:hypothetical protein
VRAHRLPPSGLCARAVRAHRLPPSGLCARAVRAGSSWQCLQCRHPGRCRRCRGGGCCLQQPPPAERPRQCLQLPGSWMLPPRRQPGTARLEASFWPCRRVPWLSRSAGTSGPVEAAHHTEVRQSLKCSCWFWCQAGLVSVTGCKAFSRLAHGAGEVRCTLGCLRTTWRWRADSGAATPRLT